MTLFKLFNEELRIYIPKAKIAAYLGDPVTYLSPSNWVSKLLLPQITKLARSERCTSRLKPLDLFVGMAT